MVASIEKHLGVRLSQGWTDVEMIMGLILLNLAGGDHVENLDRMEADEGVCEVMRKIRTHRMSRKQRRKMQVRWRKGKERSFASRAAGHRYLKGFHDEEQEREREAAFQAGTRAFIPAPNEHLQGLALVNAVCSDVTKEFKAAVLKVCRLEWHRLYRTDEDGTRHKTNQEWAEVCFVPNELARKKNTPCYLYLAIRETLSTPELPGLENKDPKLPFQTIELDDKQYKLFGLVTNMDWQGERLIWWQRWRCGKSEEVHDILKNDLAGGVMPSGYFGSNAAWWWVALAEDPEERHGKRKPIILPQIGLSRAKCRKQAVDHGRASSLSFEAFGEAGTGPARRRQGCYYRRRQARNRWNQRLIRGVRRVRLYRSPT